MRARRLEQLLHRLLVGEVVLEPAGGLGLVALARARAAALEVGAAHLLAKARVLRQPLHHDVARARQRRRRLGDPLLRVDERGSARFRGLARDGRPVPAVPEPFRQRSQPRLPRRLGLGLSFLLVRKVEVLEGDRIERPPDARLQLGRQLPLPADLLDDEGLPFDEVVPPLLRVEHLADRHLVQVSRLLLAVAGDERHRRAPLCQRQNGLGAGQGAGLRELRVLLGQPERERQRHARQRLSILGGGRSLKLSKPRRLMFDNALEVPSAGDSVRGRLSRSRAA